MPALPVVLFCPGGGCQPCAEGRRPSRFGGNSGVASAEPRCPLTVPPGSTGTVDRFFAGGDEVMRPPALARLARCRDGFVSRRCRVQLAGRAMTVEEAHDGVRPVCGGGDDRGVRDVMEGVGLTHPVLRGTVQTGSHGGACECGERLGMARAMQLTALVLTGARGSPPAVSCVARGVSGA